jgi:ribosomal protein S18 acetylase RimI-like enzyme
MVLTHRLATTDDLDLLAEWNHQLIHDEGHRNAMTVAELRQRMRDWLAGEYTATLFFDGQQAVAYALYRQTANEVYLRQFFVRRDCRRRRVGHSAMTTLLDAVWPQHLRRVVEALCHNEPAIALWRSLGYTDYCLTLEIVPGGRFPRISC